MRIPAKYYKNPIFFAMPLVVILVIAFLVWEHYRATNKPSATIPSTTSVSMPANRQSGSDQNNSAGSSSSPGSQPGTPKPQNTALIIPWGNFVSNHFPGQNGSPTTETSSCNTTPGATCYIRFTSGSKTRTLDSKVADANGAVIWNWDVKAAGFGSGAWKITAIASLNGQTKTAEDSLSLDIQ